MADKWKGGNIELSSVGVAKKPKNEYPLVKYNANGSQQYHIYFGDQTDSTTGDNLDLDDTTSYGPETTTIQSVEASARYVFAVYH